jgi:hypothetical protein
MLTKRPAPAAPVPPTPPTPVPCFRIEASVTTSLPRRDLEQLVLGFLDGLPGSKGPALLFVHCDSEVRRG